MWVIGINEGEFADINSFPRGEVTNADLVHQIKAVIICAIFDSLERRYQAFASQQIPVSNKVAKIVKRHANVVFDVNIV